MDQQAGDPARWSADVQEFGLRLMEAWDADTSSDPEGWRMPNPAWGQCAVTAVAVRDAFGGEVVWGEAELPDGRRISHYWNRIDGADLDLTRGQFPEGTRLPRGGPRRADVPDTGAYVLSHPATRARYELLSSRLRARYGAPPRLRAFRDYPASHPSLEGVGSCWEIRLRMAARGWRSDTRIMPERGARRGATFQVWFKRDDWHGRLTDVTVHSGCAVDPWDAAGDPAPHVAAIRRAVESAADRALRAWDDFPDSIPCQGLDGTMVPNAWATERDFARPPHPRGFPTEGLRPEDVARLCAGPPERHDGMALRALRLAALDDMDAIYSDDLDPWRWGSGGWHLDRRWGFTQGVSFPEWHGVRTDCVPVRQSTPELSAPWVHALLDGARETFLRLKDLYVPGSPLGDLPPCLTPSPMPAFDAENAVRREELRAAPAVLAREPAAVAAMAARWEERRRAHPILSRRHCEVTEEHVELQIESLEDEDRRAARKGAAA